MHVVSVPFDGWLFSPNYCWIVLHSMDMALCDSYYYILGCLLNKWALPFSNQSVHISYTQFTLALLIRSETGFAPMRAFTLHQLIRISDLKRIKLNHLLEMVSHRFSLLRVLIASVDATRTRTKAEQI